MPAVTLVLDRTTGKLAGATEQDQRGWARFLRRVQELADSCITFEWREPRSGPFHRRFFAMVNTAFEAQERFEDQEQFRIWLQVGAGFCDFFPHPEKGAIAVPRSIAYAKLEQGEFQELARKVWAFYTGEHARQTLYPHLSGLASYDMVWAILGQFE